MTSADTSEIVLINVSGRDKPGLMAMLTSTLAEYQVGILDIGQAVIHDELNLGILAQIPVGQNYAQVLKDLLFRAHGAGVNVRFEPVNQEDYGAWVAASGKPRYIVTLLGTTITAAQVAAVTTVLERFALNIDAVRRLSGRVPLGPAPAPTRASVEMSVRGELADERALKEGIFAASLEHGFDFSVQRDSVYRRHRRLVAFDMDSTLIEAEVIDELAKRHGVGEQVSRITRQAMAEGLDFPTSLRTRVGLLKGLSIETLKQVADFVPLTDGADRLISTLKHFGYKTAIVSGGFDYVGRRLQAELGIDYVFANEIEISGGVLTGRVSGDIIDAERKAQILKELCVREGISLMQSIAIGDGANDLPMLATAGLGVAFHAKPMVRESASHSISNFGLDSVLYLLGFTDADVDQAREG